MPSAGSPTPVFAPDSTGAVPLHVVAADDLEGWLARQPAAIAAWLRATGFAANIGEVVALPGPDGGLAGAVAGFGTAAKRARDRFHLSAAAARLPTASYAIVEPDALGAREIEALGWLLGGYRFDRYRRVEGGGQGARLVCPEGARAARIEAIAAGVFLTQDLINTPANDMGPEALEAAARSLAADYGASVEVLAGDALLERGFPMIHAVGLASSRAPRLIDIRWGPKDAAKVTLVGKGVCFDTGGLDIKPSASMALMKKDMGGAATALGLARMILALGIPLQLRVLIPAVENAISGAAMRPGDILRSRKGLSVEINNTDAEGRLIVADALTLADEEAPALIVSLATLTGAARVALGADLPPYFTDDEGVARDLASAAEREADPLWRLPLWKPYEPLIEPGIADLDNAPSGGMAGAITAALFLRRFVERAPFLHVDLYGWTPTAKPGRPKGGACQAARAILAMLEARYCPS